jgi:hypothetical protein
MNKIADPRSPAGSLISMNFLLRGQGTASGGRLDVIPYLASGSRLTVESD